MGRPRKQPEEADDNAALHQDLQFTKEYASELSAEVERSKKEIGALRKQVASLEADLEKAKAT